MSFKSNAVTASAATPAQENWKAQGFLNLYLPRINGQRAKLGAIPLKAAKPNENALLHWLNEDPTRVSQILAKLEMEYQSATPSNDSAFDLPLGN